MDPDQWTVGDSYAYLLIFIWDHLDSFVLSTKMSTPLHIDINKREKVYRNSIWNSVSLSRLLQIIDLRI